MPYSNGIYTLPFRFGTKTKPDDQFQPQVGADFDDLALMLNGGSSSPVVIKIPQTTLYVRSTGNDTTGNGLTTATAFLTIQHTFDVLSGYDTNNGFITINVGPGNFDGAAIKGPIRGGGGSRGNLGQIKVKGDSQTTTHIVGPPTTGDWANKAFCFLADQYVAIQFEALDIQVPTGITGVFLEGFCVSTLDDCRMTGADATSTALHTEGYAFFDISGTCDFYGTFNNIVALGSRGGYLHDDGLFTIYSTTGTIWYVDAGSVLHINIDDAYALGGGGSVSTTYNVKNNSDAVNYGTTNYQTVFSAKGNKCNGGRAFNFGSAVSVTSTSGLGSGGSAAVSAESNSNGGIITLTTSGSPSGSGEVVIDMNETCLFDNNAPTPYVVSAQDASAAWNGLVVVRIRDNPGDGTLKIDWQNGSGPTALTTGQTYQINYVCSG